MTEAASVFLDEPCPLRVKSGHMRLQQAMSALPPTADMCGALAHVRFVPIADMGRRRRWASMNLLAAVTRSCR